MTRSPPFPHRRFLGWVYSCLGLIGAVYAVVSLIDFFKQDYVDAIEALIFVMLVVLSGFSPLCALTGYMLLANRRAARLLTLVSSSILTVVSGLGLMRVEPLTMFSFILLLLLFENGKFVEHWGGPDTWLTLQQLGAQVTVPTVP